MALMPLGYAGVNGTIKVGDYSGTEVCIYGGEKWLLMALIDIP